MNRMSGGEQPDAERRADQPVQPVVELGVEPGVPAEQVQLDAQDDEPRPHRTAPSSIRISSPWRARPGSNMRYRT